MGGRHPAPAHLPVFEMPMCGRGKARPERSSVSTSVPLQLSSRRTKELEAQGLLFVGSGVSGGEEGARHGPSLMPGGSNAAWPHIKEIFQATAAQVNGEPCCDWVGETGAGHYVKMVHNGESVLTLMAPCA